MPKVLEMSSLTMTKCQETIRTRKKQTQHRKKLRAKHHSNRQPQQKQSQNNKVNKNQRHNLSKRQIIRKIVINNHNNRKKLKEKPHQKLVSIIKITIKNKFQTKIQIHNLQANQLNHLQVQLHLKIPPPPLPPQKGPPLHLPLNLPQKGLHLQEMVRQLKRQRQRKRKSNLTKSFHNLLLL